MEKKLIITACVLGFLGVSLGAFAAHGLQSILTASEIASFQTGVRYQFYHAFLLLFVATTPLISNNYKKIIYRLILMGVIFFSGSIYLLSIDQYVLGQSLKLIAFSTPIGGLLFLFAWATILVCFLKTKNAPK